MPITARRQVTRIADNSREIRFDSLVAEEPLEIRIGGRSLAVTMRTPGHDFELATGFLLSEGLIAGGSDVTTISYCPGPDKQEFNVLDVTLAPGVLPPPPQATRPFVSTSSCGLCGKASVDTVRSKSRHDVSGDDLRVPAHLLCALPGRLRDAQKVFDRTGGLHAAGLFDATGRLVCVREDVGRHNAFDKVIGWAAMAGRLPLRDHLILASGRASFELVQKALMAGLPMLAAVSAPSDLAAQLAEETGMTLVGFLRGDTMNVYAGVDRIL
ncbi:MAG TPA: formate dehydrogenase accessory sulfurtransferase FdhD [Acidimicrobiales bacterium]|nr:formate dehydrogenase accessory sulfurtransferase FdhD [Acidimicrobiales bacterium]